MYAVAKIDTATITSTSLSSATSGGRKSGVMVTAKNSTATSGTERTSSM